MKTGVERITAERLRQIGVKRFHVEDDVEKYPNGELALAAVCYALPPEHRKNTRYRLWPWHRDWWKPNQNNRIRELEKAGALIAAEIDRLTVLSQDGEQR